ncbi:glycosyltransferase family 8 protein [Caballeronia insecticola]|uniref:Glycosyl transferase family 8 n=1 Tax=Caballeronia insecticola TaxID=758793 RepID=R4X2Z3_9BURK|nr:glycosyltransferase family 8 protein [Caballeronia insecticola]BAN25907.1 glycosyl transferase family 8 [Caballeronia insecticola]
MPTSINIVLCFDKNYAYYAAVSTYSLFVNSKSEVRVFWIVPGEDESHVVSVAEQLRNNIGLNVSVVPASSAAFAEWKTVHHFTRGMYLRLLIPTLIDAPRVIYLDADTLVLTDLHALYSTPLGDKLIAGVLDPGGARTSKIPRQADDPYINSGVLVMNLDALRQDQMFEKAQAIYAQYEREAAFPDQCVINKYAEDRKLTVGQGWNRLMSAAEITQAQFESVLQENDLSIIHFVTPVKPWQQWCNPCVGEFWWNYAKQLGIDGLKPQEITTLDQAIQFARVLDTNERYLAASRVKDEIIAILMRRANERSHGE